MFGMWLLSLTRAVEGGLVSYFFTFKVDLYARVKGDVTIGLL